MDLKETELKAQNELTKKLFHFLKGDANAVRFCIDLVYILHLWDDLYDRDRERTKEDINAAFRIALVDMPGNPFYFSCIGELKTLIMNTILQWQDANKLETQPQSDHDLHMAYMLRAGLLQIFNYCAYLIGGPEWVEQVGPDMRRMYEENFFDYLQEMKNKVKTDVVIQEVK